jgi:hypothetical protein
VSSTHARKSSQDDGGLGGKAQRNTTKENSTANEHSPARFEEYSASLYAIRSNLSELFALIKQSHAVIDAAFAGQPFLRHLPPNAPANKRRFYAYIEQHRQVSKLLGKALQLWTLSFGFGIEKSKPLPVREKINDEQESHESSSDRIESR